MMVRVFVSAFMDHRSPLRHGELTQSVDEMLGESLLLNQLYRLERTTLHCQAAPQSV